MDIKAYFHTYAYFACNVKFIYFFFSFSLNFPLTDWVVLLAATSNLTWLPMMLVLTFLPGCTWGDTITYNYIGGIQKISIHHCDLWAPCWCGVSLLPLPCLSSSLLTALLASICHSFLSGKTCGNIRFVFLRIQRLFPAVSFYPEVRYLFKWTQKVDAPSPSLCTLFHNAARLFRVFFWTNCSRAQLSSFKHAAGMTWGTGCLSTRNKNCHSLWL